MSTTFRRYAPDQTLLLPADMREWLPKGHLAYHVSDLVDGLDLTAFFAPYAGDGRRNAPYAPRMMVKVLLYAYATGVFSSRGIARKLEEDVAFRGLAAGNFPQHRTLCEFRRRHLEDFKKLFISVVRLAQELGLARVGKLSVDGTKVRTNASKRKAMSYGRMPAEERRLTTEVEALLRKARDTDAEEDVRLGTQVRGDELPAEFRRPEDRLAAIRAAKARLEAQQRAADDARGRQPDQDRNPKGGSPYKRAYGEPDEKAQSNFTDPESGIMKTSSEGFQQCYNAQMAVDGEQQLVVGPARFGGQVNAFGYVMTSNDGDDPVGGVGNAIGAFSKTLVGAVSASTASSPSTGACAASRSKLIGDSYARLECRRWVLYHPSMKSKIARRASADVRNDDRSSSSHSSVAKKLSHIAWSKQSPTDPIEGRTPAARQRCPNASEVYWQPWKLS